MSAATLLTIFIKPALNRVIQGNAGRMGGVMNTRLEPSALSRAAEP
jgi:hypothetical protein